MNNQETTTIHKRVNITLPGNTLRLLDRISTKGNRSGFVDRAVRFYIKKNGYANLKKQLRLGAIKRAERDIMLTEEWFLIDESVWQKKRNK